MNLFKKVTVAGVLAFALLAIAIPVKAQAPYSGWQPLVSASAGITNGANAATNINLMIDCSKQSKIAVMLRPMYDAGTTNAFGACFRWSIDGSTNNIDNVQMTKVVTFTQVSGAGVSSILITNLDSWGCQNIQLQWITNSGAAGTTNFQAGYNVKVSAPGGD